MMLGDKNKNTLQKQNGYKMTKGVVKQLDAGMSDKGNA